MSGFSGSGVGEKMFRPLALADGGAALRRARVRVVGRALVDEASCVVEVFVRV